MSQLVRLVGVLDDGSNFGPRTPTNTSTTITFPKATDVTVEVAVINNAGVKQDLSSDSNLKIWLSWSRNIHDQPAFRFKQVFGLLDKPLRKNTLLFQIPASSTVEFASARYFFDVSIKFNSIQYQLIRPSVLFLSPSLNLTTS